MVLTVWNRTIHTLPVLALAVLLLVASGCTSSGGTPVKGKVIYAGDNKPLTTGSVRFVPDKAKGNSSPDEPSGTITEAGSYELRTKNQIGAPPGWYKVCVVSEEVVDSANPTAAKSFVDKKYNKPETSELEVEIKAGAAAGAYDLKVTPP